MVQPGLGGGALDTPRTNIGDATYLSRRPDFADVSMEASFQSPGQDGDFLRQIRNGRSNGVSLRTPRQRGPLADRRNLPQSIGGAEFTPLLKSVTRNSARKPGKENGASSSAALALERIDEDDMSPLPKVDTSIYLGSRNQSYLDNTLPHVESSSVASTPLAMQPRRGLDKGPLQDGNQLSLREQENVIDRIEKENFGLKLKIHFLEESLRKAGPGFSEAALKENTDLKVDVVTMQRELHKYKKTVASAERDLETYKRQMEELQERTKRKRADADQTARVEQLQKMLEEKETDIVDLRRQLNQSRNDDDQVEKLRDDLEDLRANLREQERQLTERDDELDEFKDKLGAAEERAREAQEKAVELENSKDEHEELEEAKDRIADLEHHVRQLEEQSDEFRATADEAVSQRERAESDLEELQEEMANKSSVTKGLSRQIEEKMSRLQQELDQSGQDYASLEKSLARANEENERVRAEMEEMRAEHAELRHADQSKTAKTRELEAELLELADERNHLQARCDAHARESEARQREIQELEAQVLELQNAEEEKEDALEVEKDLLGQYQREMDRLNDEITNLQAEVRERDNLYDNDSEKWENEKQTLLSERERAREQAAGLQRTIDRLRQAEGSLSSKGSELQKAIDSEKERHKSEEAVMTRQINDLQAALETRQALLTSLRNELSAIRDELRQTQIDYQSQVNKAVALEDEVEVLRTKVAASGTPGRSNAAARDMQILRDQVSRSKADLEAARSSLAKAQAERDELQAQLSRRATQDNDTLQIDRERLDLRSAKMRLDHEVRRFQDENQSLSSRHAAAEKALKEELEAASAQESKLRQRVADLERQLRESPAPARRVTKPAETEQLEQKLADTELALAEARQESREMELRAGQMIEDLQNRLDDLEDQKIVMDDLLHQAREEAEDAKAQSDRTTRRLERKLDEAERERQTAMASRSETKKQSKHLRRSQAEVESLENDVRQRQEHIDELIEVVTALRTKLDDARSERAAFRLTAEKLQRDIRLVQTPANLPASMATAQDDGRVDFRALAKRHHHGGGGEHEAVETLVRAAEGAEERRRREMKGLVMQMEWMQARWEREAALRCDAAFAKRFLQLQLEVAHAWYVLSFSFSPFFFSYHVCISEC